VLHEDARLLERAGVEEELDPLAGREPALGMELGDPLLAAAPQDGFASPAEFFDGGRSGQRRGSCWRKVAGRTSRIIST
jgi:hypothetical protein